jgi:hypothetical protein
MGLNRILGGLANAAVGIACLACTLFALAPPAAAQGVYAAVANDLIRARLGESGTENNGNVSGRLAVDDVRTLNTIMFGPTTDLTGVSQGVPVPGSFLTLRIDGGAPAGGSDHIVGEATGVWLVLPTELNGKIIARWATTPSGTATGVPPIQINIEISLVHDVVQYKFTVFNGIVDTVPPTPGTAAHTVGLRFAQNYTKDSAAFQNEGPIFLPTGSQICTETTLVGGQVPPYWKAIDTTGANPVGGILKPTPAPTGFIPPDQVLWGSATIMSELWEHTPIQIPGFNFCTDAWDVAAAVYFNPRTLSPGQGADFITYFGRMDSTIDFTSPWAAGIDALSTLSLTSGLPTPNPFPVTAFITNQAGFALSNASATITLPKGLKLAPGADNTPTKNVASVAEGQEARFTWQVVPDGTASGRLSYSVAFAAGPGTQGKVVTREVDIPALPTQTLGGGLQMVSFPYTFADGTPTTALGLSDSDFGLLKWDPTVNQYVAVDRIVPGQGYWLNLATSKTITLQNATPVSDTSKFEIALKNGWNQIGNPFLRIVNFADVQVLDKAALKTYTVDEASAAGLIQPVLFRYDTTTGAYAFDPTSNVDMVPFVGYWIKALSPNVSLLVPPPPISRAARAITARPSSRFNGWKLSVVASSNGHTDSSNYIGLATGSQDGRDKTDIEKPPAAKQGLTVGLVQNVTGGRSAVLAQDIQQANGGRKSWNVTVTTPTASQDVTLSWPSIATVPRGYELFITDTATGIRQQMRQVPSLRVNTGEAGTRAFTINAEPTAGSGVFSLSVTAHQPGRAGGATSIEVGSTQAAAISVRILSNGRAVRTLTGRSASLGSNASFMWDNRDAKGSSVAAGAYTIEVTGTTSDGQTRRAIQPVVIVR